MSVEVVPPVSEDARAALVHALARLDVRLDGLPDAYRSPWRRAATHEAVDDVPAPARYAPSPRSTRGATRA